MLVVGGRERPVAVVTWEQREGDGVDAVLLLGGGALGVGDVHLELDGLLEDGGPGRGLVFRPEAGLGDHTVTEAGNLQADKDTLTTTPNCHKLHCYEKLLQRVFLHIVIFFFMHLADTSKATYIHQLLQVQYLLEQRRVTVTALLKGTTLPAGIWTHSNQYATTGPHVLIYTQQLRVYLFLKNKHKMNQLVNRSELSTCA